MHHPQAPTNEAAYKVFGDCSALSFGVIGMIGDTQPLSPHHPGVAYAAPGVRYLGSVIATWPDRVRRVEPVISFQFNNDAGGPDKENAIVWTGLGQGIHPDDTEQGRTSTYFVGTPIGLYTPSTNVLDADYADSKPVKPQHYSYAKILAISNAIVPPALGGNAA